VKNSFFRVGRTFVDLADLELQLAESVSVSESVSAVSPPPVQPA
jgi:hypothetical protein